MRIQAIQGRNGNVMDQILPVCAERVLNAFLNLLQGVRATCCILAAIAVFPFHVPQNTLPLLVETSLHILRIPLAG